MANTTTKLEPIDYVRNGVALNAAFYKRLIDRINILSEKVWQLENPNAITTEDASEVLNGMADDAGVNTIVNDITAVSSAVCESLTCGDFIIKRNPTNHHDHLYFVTDKSPEDMCLVYVNYETIEEVYYAKSQGSWAYVETHTVNPGGTS